MDRTAAIARSQSALSRHHHCRVQLLSIPSRRLPRLGAGLPAGDMVDRHGDIPGRARLRDVVPREAAGSHGLAERQREGRSHVTKIIVDGAEVDVPPEYTLLQACEVAG